MSSQHVLPHQISDKQGSFQKDKCREFMASKSKFDPNKDSDGLVIF